MLESPICRNYKKGRIPEEPVSPLSDLPTAAPYGGQAGSEDYLGTPPLLDKNPSQRSNDDIVLSPQEGQPESALHPGRHLVKIISVRGYMHNFQDYFGPRARLRMKILEGPDAGKLLFDNISLPHPKESEGMRLRQVRIAYRLGLIPRGTEGTIQVNWKLLEGVVCWVDVAYKGLGGRIVITVDNYEIYKSGITMDSKFCHR